MLHPPYFPDLTPATFHLLRSLQNSLNGVNFNLDLVIESDLVPFANSDKDYQ